MLKVFEFADKRKDIFLDLRSKTNLLIEHMLKIYFFPDSPYLDHWEEEVYSFYLDVPKQKNNKFPKEDFIYHTIFGSKYEDGFTLPRKKETIKRLKSKYPNYNEPTMDDFDNAIEFINEYVHWLSKELSKKGETYEDEVKSKIKELLVKYSRIER